MGVTWDHPLKSALRLAHERGWVVHVIFDTGIEEPMVSADRGDSNCPHKTTYSPKDGHGYEHLPLFSDEGGEHIAEDMEDLAEWIRNLPPFYEREAIKKSDESNSQRKS
jgi:hypothetical protein